jgi:pimeloyl-ACP methyl ester carboxylesterase
MKLVYIHGANATSESFNYIRDHIGGADLVLNYASSVGFENNLQQLTTELADQHQIFFIAHSLGGVYALHLANAIPDQVLGAVSLSTPYGGVTEADFAKYFMPFNRLMRDIGPASWPMRQAADIKITHPWCNIISTRGAVPWISGPNDGVVTLESQRHLSHSMDTVDVAFNHYEILLNQRVIRIIKQRIRQITGPVRATRTRLGP